MTKAATKTTTTKKSGKNEKAKPAQKTQPKRLTVDDLKDIKAGKCEFGDKSGCGT